MDEWMDGGGRKRKHGGSNKQTSSRPTTNDSEQLDSTTHPFQEQLSKTASDERTNEHDDGGQVRRSYVYKLAAPASPSARSK